MTVVSNNFEGGTDGVAISTANSGGASGTAFDAPYSTGFTYSAADATQGSMGASVAGSGATGGGQWNLASVAHVAAKMKFKAKATPSSDTHLMRLQNASATRLFSIHITGTTQKIRVDDASGTTGVFTFANALTAGTYYRLEAYLVCGSTTSNGTIKVGYYLGNSTTPVESVYLNTAANVGTATTFTTLIMGKYSGTAEAYGFDEFAYDVSASDLIGVGSTTPPTVSTPANQNVSAASTVTASVTASSSSGVITGYAWSYVYPASGGPTLTGATTNTVSFTAGSAGALYLLQCVVTDSNSVTTTVTTEVRVPTSGTATTLPGAAAATVGTWSNVGGGATAGDALADGSDTTYVESAALSATETSIRDRVQPITARSSLNLTIREQQDTGGTTTSKVRLYEGATLRQTWTLTITTAWADYPLTLTTPAAITDWGNLYLEFAATSP